MRQDNLSIVKLDDGVPEWLSGFSGGLLVLAQHDLGVLGSSPTWGPSLSREPVGDSLSPSPSPHPWDLSLSQMDKY